MKKIILIGGGGHCRACIDVIEQTGLYQILGILDQQDKLGTKLLGYKYIGTDDDISSYQNKNIEFLITLGQIKSPDVRKKLFNLIQVSGNKLATIVSPRAYVSKWSSLGKGTIVMHDSLINSNTTIGDNCIINTKALVEHDCVIGNHCHISTAAVVNGNVNICDDTFFGSNAVSTHSTTIAKKSFIKAGTRCKGENNHE
jgi:sugar O-acyltransferase (sialic acid O-acetyltransferase NeuD family)